MMVSFYQKANDVTSQDPRQIGDVLTGIRTGQWDAQVLPVRALYPGKDYDLRKKTDIPGFTVSGVFSRREDDFLLEHSHLLAMDIDRSKNLDLDINAVRRKLQADSFVYACFLSLSGDGLAVLYKVPGDNHRGSWRALKQYLWQGFGLVVDKACPNESRLRFVSSDPDLYLNEASATFEETLEEEKPKIAPRAQRPETSTYTQRNDTEAILLQIGVRMIERAVDGGKHEQVRNAGHLMGGYVASGCVDENRAFDALYGAVLAKPNVADLKNAEQAIRSGFVSGASKPLLPTWMHHHVRRQEQEGMGREAIIAGMSVCEGIAADKLGPAVEAVLDAPNWHLNTFWKLVENSKAKDSFKLVIERVKLRQWLIEEGFCQRGIGEKIEYFRVQQNVVYRVQRYTMRQHTLAYVESLPERFDDTTREDLSEVLQTQMRALFDKDITECLPALSDTFVRDTATVFYSFYQNCWVETTAFGRVARPYAELPGLIWETQRKPHTMHILDDVSTKTADFHQFTVNLTAQDPERLDQLQRALAYAMHGYKERSNARCVILMDEIGEVGKNSGGTGKGLLMQAVEQMVTVSSIDGTSFDFKDPFRYEEVADDARVVFFDEWKPQRNSFEMLFSILTGGLPINRKYAAKKTVSFELAPKFVIATNEVVTGDDDSSNRRRIEVALAKRYSAAYTPRDEFGHDFFGAHWDDDEYIRFYNLMLLWMQRHLACERQPLLLHNASVAARGLAQDVGMNFHEFAQDLLENTRLAAVEGKDHRIWAADAYLAYQTATGDKRTSAQTFNKKMEAIGLLKKKCYERDSAHRNQRYFLLSEHADL